MHITMELASKGLQIGKKSFSEAIQSNIVDRGGPMCTLEVVAVRMLVLEVLQLLLTPLN